MGTRYQETHAGVGWPTVKGSTAKGRRGTRLLSSRDAVFRILMLTIGLAAGYIPVPERSPGYLESF
jgi:hypothetical protein